MIEWVGLTDDERRAIFESMPGGLSGFLNTWGWLPFCKAVEEKLRQKNDRSSLPWSAFVPAVGHYRIVDQQIQRID